jgi:hypothetical protein
MLTISEKDKIMADQYKIKTPKYSLYNQEMSDWVCYLFGATEEIMGLRYIPVKGKEPNRFVRWMMKICFDCKWVKQEK